MYGWGEVGHVGVGWVMQGWCGSCRGRVGHARVGWVMQGWHGVRHVGMAWDGSWRCGGVM